jgi:DNA (cytosine-5)-methyltransferase 1
MNELALFAGAGGGILGGHLLGWRTVCAVEWEPYAACVLASRQNDGLLPPFPIWDDVQTFDGKPWRGIVDVISGGFPCQDISAAGKGAGIDGERSGMWREMARIIHEVRPRFVFVENSPMLTSRGLGTVLGDLASMGFDAKWGVLGAADVGAPHQRDRIWIRAKRRDILPHTELHGHGWREQQSEGAEKTNVANTNSFNDAMRGDSQDHAEGMARRRDEPRGSLGNSGAGCQESPREGSNVAYSMRHRSQGIGEDGRLEGSLGLRSGEGGDQEQRLHMAHSQDERNVRGDRQLGVVEEEHHHRGSQTNGGGKWWEVEPDLGRVADGVAARVDRLKAIGNGQVPEVARTAWRVM